MPDDNRYLQRRGLGKTYLAAVKVPPALWSAVGKRVLLRSLKTRDESEARKRRWLVVAEFKADIERARRGKSGQAVDGDLTAEALAMWHKFERERDEDKALKLFEGMTLGESTLRTLTGNWRCRTS